MKKIAFLTIIFITFFIGVCKVSATNCEIIVTRGVDVETDATVTGNQFKLVSSDGTEIANWTNTGEKRITIDKAGTYTLYETKEVPGYYSVYMTGPRIIEIKENQTSPEIISFRYRPEKITFHTVPGVKLQLLNQKGEEIDLWIQQPKIDHSISIPKLSRGTYTVKVIEAPSGFVISTKTKTFIVDETTRAMNITIDVKKMESSETIITNVPNTLASNSMVLYGIGAIVTLLGIRLVYKHVKQN